MIIREIDLIKIGKPSAKRNILIDCGIHAREFISPATCLYMINRVKQIHLHLQNNEYIFIQFS
jgi:hypothetical protein